MRCLRIAASLAAVVLSAVAPVLAHDLWIEPASFISQPDQVVPVSLYIGHPAEGGFEPVRRSPGRWERFALIGPHGESAIPGLDGSTPAGVIRPAAPGRYVVLLRSRDAVSRLPAEAFNDYLTEEGLEHVLSLRGEWSEDDEPGVELYSRAVKALVTLSADESVPPGPPDRPLGMRLELVAETDPAQSAPDEPFRVRLLFEHAPLGGALVEARPLGEPIGEPSTKLSARTDAEGRVSFSLPGADRWLITAVHMVQAPPDRNADWQSIWAALTFQRSEAPLR